MLVGTQTQKVWEPLVLMMSSYLISRDEPEVRLLLLSVKQDEDLKVKKLKFEI